MKTRPTALVLLALVATLSPAGARAQATSPPYLSQMPTAARVKAGVRGADALDTSARQAAAFWHLMWIIRDLNGPRDASRQLTPDAQRLINTYNSNQLWYSLKENAPPPQDAQRWAKLRESYENDPAFLDGLLRQLFPPEFRAGYYRATGKRPPAGPTNAQPTTADSRPRPSTPPGVPALNYHGLYLDNADETGRRGGSNTYRWLRFYEDGTVIGATTAGAGPEQVGRWLKKPYETSGQYSLRGSGINFSLVSPERVISPGAVIGGKFTYTGTIGNNSLRIDSINGARSARIYEFVPLDGEAANSAEATRPSTPSGTPASAEAYFAQGSVFEGAKDYAKAVEAYKKAIALDGSFVGAYNRLAFTYYSQGEHELALSAYKQSLAVKPDQGGIFTMMGYVHVTLKQYPEAIEAFRSDLRLVPDYAPAHLGLGKAYHDLRQYPDAVAAYKEGLRLQPDSAPGLFGLGALYAEMGRRDDALGVLRRLQARDKAMAGKLYEKINKDPRD
jgi:Tfp pilus assembly protein PilF